MAPSSSIQACPEKRLLVCCARTQASSRLTEEIVRLTAEPLDWDFLLRDAGENALTPLVARHLSACASGIPSGVTEALRESMRASVARSLMLTAELIRILDLLRSSGVTAIPYKGPTLAAQAYGAITLRQFDDLDIIIWQQDVPKVHEIMTGIGFSANLRGRFSAGHSQANAAHAIPTHAIPGEYSYRDAERKLLVEFHTDRTLRHFPLAPDLAALAARLVSVELSGREVRTFAAEEGLTFLAVHGAKDMWERLSWVVDVAELARVHPDLDWDRAFRFAQSVKAERMLHVALILSTELLEAPLADEVRARICTDATAAALALEFKRRLLSREWSPLGVVRRFDVRRRMVAGNTAGLAYSLRLTLAPAQDDFSEIPLPRALAPLYVLLRPFRLLRKYGVANRSRPS